MSSTPVENLHDMDSCVADAHGDAARFAALVQHRFPYMTRDRRVERVEDYLTDQRLTRERAARTARTARSARRQPWISAAFTVAIVVLLLLR